MGRWSRWQVYVFWAAIVVSLVDLVVMGVDFYLDGEAHFVPLLVANAILIICAASLYTTRSRALTYLRSSEERYRLLMEEASDAIFITDLSAVIVSANRRAVELTGYSRDELAGRPAQDLMPPGAVIDPDRMVATLRGGHAITMETALLTKNGTIVPVELSLTLVAETFAQSIVRPISERKLAEEALRRSEALFRAVSEMTSDYAYSMKVNPDGSLTPEWLTGAYERVTGYTVEEAHERGGWQTLVHPDDVPAMSEVLARSLRAGGSAEAEFRIVTKSGEIRHLRSWSRFERDDPDGPVVRIVGAVSDLTAQKHLEADLGNTERRFRDLYERLPIGIYRGAWGRLLSEANPTCVAMFGYPDEKTFLARHPREHYVDLEERERWLRRIEEDRVVVNYELHYKRYDGTYFWGRNTARLVHDDNGTPWIEGGIIDITDEKKLDEELRATVRDLQRADADRRRLLTHLVKAKEEERNRVASDIHDDSVQVMTAVAIDLERLSRKVQDPERRSTLEDLEERVREAVGRLRTMVFELRPPTLDEEGVGSALRLYLEEFSIDTGIEYDLNNELDPEPSNPTRVVLYRIAQEALTNVRKHSSAQRVIVQLQRRDLGISMTVTDDGKGFDVFAEDLVSPGHIGLSEMRERAEISGGRFGITSDLGKGTTVTAWIPEVPE